MHVSVFYMTVMYVQFYCDTPLHLENIYPSLWISQGINAVKKTNANFQPNNV